MMDLALDKVELVAALGAAATDVARRAHAPYSHFHVGAAVLAEDGRIFVGCNVENVSFPEGVCAETAAIGAMVAGGGRRILRLALWARGPDLCTPCGGCRQRIAELGTAATRIHLFRDDEAVLHTCLGELLPNSFGTASVVANRARGAAPTAY